MLDDSILRKLNVSRGQVGIMIIDHGSRRVESNQLLEKVVQLFRETVGHAFVEAAHMEIARPSIADAFDKLIAAGAKFVVAYPYFLSPGRHWSQDVPALVADAAKQHEGVSYMVAAPLGLHPLMMSIIEERIDQCLEHRLNGGDACAICQGDGSCRIQTVEADHD